MRFDGIRDQMMGFVQNDPMRAARGNPQLTQLIQNPFEVGRPIRNVRSQQVETDTGNRRMEQTHSLVRRGSSLGISYVGEITERLVVTFRIYDTCLITSIGDAL